MRASSKRRESDTVVYGQIGGSVANMPVGVHNHVQTETGQASNWVQLKGITTTQRNALTAANGMVIYNSTDNKFQGYENGSWANLNGATLL